MISAVAVMAISVTYMESWRPGVAVAISLVLASVIQILSTVLHRHEVQAGRGGRRRHRDKPGHDGALGFSVGLESAVLGLRS